MTRHLAFSAASGHDTDAALPLEEADWIPMFWRGVVIGFLLGILAEVDGEGRGTAHSPRSLVTK